MYVEIKQTPNKKDAYVYVKETVVVDGKVKHKTVKSFGTTTKLKERSPGFVERLKRQYQEEANTIKQQRFEKDLSTSVSSEQISTCVPVLSYALEPLRKLWKDTFNLPYRLNYLKSQSSIKYDLNAIISYLTFCKIINPSSILSSFENKASYLFNPLGESSLQDMYWALSFFGTCKDSIVNHLNNFIEEKIPRDYTMVFYDVTNVFFETPLSDEEINKIDKEGFAQIEHLIEPYLNDILEDNGEYNFAKLPSDVYKEVKLKIYLKLRGLSKEHRFDLPLVSMVLIIDNNGFPINYEILSGATSEYHSMPEV